MVYDALLSVFGPSLGGIIAANYALSRISSLGAGISSWARRGVKLVVAGLAAFWTPFALSFSTLWGVQGQTLSLLTENVASFQGQIPYMSLLAPGIFLSLVVFAFVYFTILGGR